MFFEIISIKGMNLLHSDEIAEGRYLHPAMMPELLSCTQIDVVNHNINLLIQKFNCLSRKFESSLSTPYTKRKSDRLISKCTMFMYTRELSSFEAALRLLC